MDWITQPETWIAFITLVALELVLGVDNVIFISILAGKLPQEQQQRARTTGIMLAVITRVLLLLSLSWIISLEEDVLSIGSFHFSGRDLVLLAGGLFLLGKSTLGRPFILLTISSPQNLAKLDRYREISRQMADPRGLTPQQIEAVPVVGGILAAEIAGVGDHRDAGDHRCHGQRHHGGRGRDHAPGTEDSARQ